VRQIKKSHMTSELPRSLALLRAGRFRVVYLDVSVGAKPAGVKRRNLKTQSFLAVELASTIATFDNSHLDTVSRTTLILKQLFTFSDLAFLLRMKECRPRSVETVLAWSQTGPQIQSRWRRCK
jgi:hypothetical protein